MFHFTKRITGSTIKQVALAISLASLSAFSAPTVWDGSADISWYSDDAQTFNLTTAEQLAGLAQLVNNGISNFFGKTITLGADIFLNDTTGAGDNSWDTSTQKKWTAIGTSKKPFKGEFDGIAGSKRRKIYGLYVNDTTSYQGLFGYTDGVTITNLELIYANLFVSNLAGGLVGYSHNGAISNIVCKANVSGKDTIGGIIGEASNTAISKIYNEGAISGSKSVGGLIGITSNAISGTENNFIYFKGNVKGTSFVGGLFGKGSSTYSYSLGTVSGTGSFVGGITGLGTVRNSYHENGAVEGDTYVGGITGSGDCYDSHMSGNVKGRAFVGGLSGSANEIQSSYHQDGIVKGSGPNIGGLVGTVKNFVINSYHKNGNIHGTDYVGGLAGICSGSMQNSYHENGNVYGNNYVGGIVGLAEKTLSSIFFSGGNIVASGYAVGGIVGNATRATLDSIVNVEVFGSVTGTDSVGGIVGSTISHRIKKAHSTRDIKGENFVGGVAGYACNKDYPFNYDVDSSYATGNVFGNNFVGGIAGSTCSVNETFSKGNVFASGNKVGGIAGSAKNSSAINNFNNVYSTGNVSGKDSVGGIIGISDVYLKGVHSEGSVFGRNTVGGLTGLSHYSITNSFSIGDSVVGTFNVGGLVGVAAEAIDSSYSIAHVRGDDNIGGLIGSAYNNITNSYSTGNVIGDTSKSSAGNDNIGGLVGYHYKKNIKKSFALGNIKGTTKLGGLVGRFEGDTISQSYSKGSVTGLYYGDPSDEIGNYYIGGLIGYGNGFIEESYTSSTVSGIENQPIYTGCVVGYVEKSMEIKNAYYDKTLCTLDVEGRNQDGDPNIATINNNPAKTSMEMLQKSTFENWDFTDLWSIQENSSTPYFIYFFSSIANANIVTESLDEIYYDGTAKEPAISSVSLWNESLVKDKDYTISYLNNIDAGKANIVICGTGNYTGCKFTNFTILPIEKKITIEPLASVTYDNLIKEPIITVYDESKDIVSSSNYKVFYTNNVNAGQALVSVELNGNFSGSASSYFTIDKATPSIETIPTASSIDQGMTLSQSVLTGGSASVKGAFVWENPSTTPTLDIKEYAVTFEPSDTANYNTFEKIFVPLTIIEKVRIIAKTSDDDLIKDTIITKGHYFQLPKVPKSFSTTFIGWFYNDQLLGQPGEKIMVNQDMNITGVLQINRYRIKFVVENKTFEIDSVEYGNRPICSKTPTKDATSKYSYTFSGWSPYIVSATENATYTALFDSVLIKYTISFVNGKDTLKKETYSYGEEPSTPTITPTRKNTNSHTLKFKGWTPAITSVTQDYVYTAVFDSTIRSFKVVFMNGKDTLESKNVYYGKTVTYTGTKPTKKSSQKYRYKFTGWDQDITAAIKEDVTYHAVFDSISITSIPQNKLKSNTFIFSTIPKAIQFDNVNIGSNFAIMDLQGRLIKRGFAQQKSFTIFVNNPETYIIKVDSKTQILKVR